MCTGLGCVVHSRNSTFVNPIASFWKNKNSVDMVKYSQEIDENLVNISLLVIMSDSFDTRYFDDILSIYHDIFNLDCTWIGCICFDMWNFDDISSTYHDIWIKLGICITILGFF